MRRVELEKEGMRREEKEIEGKRRVRRKREEKEIEGKRRVRRKREERGRGVSGRYVTLLCMYVRVCVLIYM